MGESEIPQSDFGRLYCIQGRQSTIVPSFDDNQEVRDNLFATFGAAPYILHTLQQVDTLLRVYDDRLDESGLVSVRNATQ